MRDEPLNILIIPSTSRKCRTRACQPALARLGISRHLDVPPMTRPTTDVDCTEMRMRVRERRRLRRPPPWRSMLQAHRGRCDGGPPSPADLALPIRVPTASTCSATRRVIEADPAVAGQWDSPLLASTSVMGDGDGACSSRAIRRTPRSIVGAGPIPEHQPGPSSWLYRPPRTGNQARARAPLAGSPAPRQPAPRSR